jgi:RNA-binding protein
MRRVVLPRSVVDLTPHEIAALRASGQSVDAAFQVGKAGVTDGVVKELQTHLEREPLVKVKLLKGAREDADTRTLAEDLAQRARVRLIEVRGHTALFYRAPRHKRAPGEF